EERHQVVGVAGSGEEALEVARAERPDIVLMDLTMPGMGGLEATRRLKAEVPNVSVVVLTASDSDDDLFEALKAGAEGYLLKDLQADQFFALLGGVSRGEPALTPVLARKLLAEFQNPKSEAPKSRNPDALTQREAEVLEVMVQGVTTNKGLSEHFNVSENTIKFHMRNILDKLHVNNRAQVVSYALRHGIVDPS
ncbi:MAG: response regulator transcription factor, partial [Acidobacteriota bacterium]